MEKASTAGCDASSEIESQPFLNGHQRSLAVTSRSRLGTLPLLEDKILIDDQFASKVLVFPKVLACGGTLDPDEMIPDPMQRCRRIFVRQRNWDSTRTMDTGFEAFANGPVSALLYHEVVRTKIVQVLRVHGLQASSFESIDGDEVFMKVWLDHRGEIVRNLAQRYQYKMPFRHSSYADAHPTDNHPGGEPMRNHHGQPVLAYAEYQLGLHDRLEAFREADVIRILESHLDEWLDIAEMLQQGVVSQAFTAANYETSKLLHKQWANLRKTFCLPNNYHIDDVRDYFGEGVAFFFRWLAYYTRMLVPLACVGLLCGLVSSSAFRLDLEHRRYLQVLYTFVLIGWASVYNALFKHHAARERQRWGMKDCDAALLGRPTAAPMLGTRCFCLGEVFVKVFPALYCLIFMGAILALEDLCRTERLIGKNVFRKHRYFARAVCVKIFSFLWNSVAPWLANLQRHATQARWDDALTWILAIVKLFVTLFPFLYLAFVKAWDPAACSPTLAEAAKKVYQPLGCWPRGVPRPHFDERGNATHTGHEPDLSSWLHGHFYKDPALGNVCINGCFPYECFQKLHANGTGTGSFDCVTNCIHDLEMSLMSVYLLHIACTVFFMLIPIGLAKFAMETEIGKANQQTGDRPFSLLQFQAKCYQYASYTYGSWGGSYVEDFLELAIGFALLTCFGVVLPAVSIIALFSHVVEYRLLAYRMTNVTCRPFPHGSEGIGTWQTVFEAISVFAVATNVGLAVTQMYPMREWQLDHKLLAFIVLEHALYLIHVGLTAAIPDEPRDVVRAEDYNAHFKRRFLKHGSLVVPQDERCNLSFADISAGSRSDCSLSRVDPQPSADWL